MLAKITTKNQLTLPKAVMQQVGRTEYVEVTFENGRIILTPMQVRPADAVKSWLHSALPSRTWRMRSLGAGEKKRDAYSGCAGY
mgnify:CR=1 FL=1